MRAPQASRQIRVIRISKHPKRPVQRAHSHIRSSVDSWLSSAPSISESIVHKTPVKKVSQPSVIVLPPAKSPSHRGLIAFLVIVFLILLLCSIIGVVLGVESQTSTTTSTKGSTKIATSSP